MKRLDRTGVTVMVVILGMFALSGATVWLRATSVADGATLDHTASAWKPDGLVVTPRVELPGGFQRGDLVVAVGGRSMEEWAQPLTAFGVPRPSWQPGDTATYTVKRSGKRLDLPVTLRRYSFVAFLQREWGSLLAGLVWVMVAIFIVLKRPHDQTAWVFLLVAAGVATAPIFLLDWQVSDFVTGPVFLFSWVTPYCAYLLTIAAALHFALLFPAPFARLLRYSWAVPLIYGIPFAVTLAVLAYQWFTTPSRLAWWREAGLGLSLIVAVYAAFSVAALVRGYRAARDPISRQQARWLVLALSLTSIGGLAIAELPEFLLGYPLLPFSFQPLVGLVVPLALAAAVLRYRLFDIDIIINRALVYGGLTAMVVGTYVLIVGTLGNLFHASGSLWTSLLATSLIALAFQPVRERLQRGVNRLLYGQRDEPYAVLSQLGQRLEAAVAPDTVLPAVTETVALALKLPYVAIALQQNGARCDIAAAAGIPTGNPVCFPLTYQSETVGHLIVSPRASNDEFKPTETRLLADVARQVGVVVHAVRLTGELQEARHRLVDAREEERRRLRRDLHDGLGPELAGQTLKLETARDMMHADPQRAEALIDEVITKSQGVVAEVRRLVYALRPPTLDELGLVGAIRQQMTQCELTGVHMALAADDCPTPLPAAVEVAAYRIAQEAFANVLRHARASTCTVSISFQRSCDHGALLLTISDDGIGLRGDRLAGIGLRSMRERAEELGGWCRVECGKNGGTQVSAYLPFLSGGESL